MNDDKKPQDLSGEDLDMAVGGAKLEAAQTTEKREQHAKLSLKDEGADASRVIKSEESAKMTVSKGEAKRKHL